MESWKVNNAIRKLTLLVVEISFKLDKNQKPILVIYDNFSHSSKKTRF